jgi:hypothetical protein|tara:strand:- start:19 stop:231 length:213 start_codon:yes stop_codon:yes gene_type:complete
MSAEKITNLKKDPLSIVNSEVNDENIPRVVDINHLIARARKEEKKLDKINMLFFGMFALLVLIAGILLSL